MIDKNDEITENRTENTIEQEAVGGIDIAPGGIDSEAMQAAVHKVVEKRSPKGKIYGLPSADEHFRRYGRLTPQQHLFVQGLIAGKGKSQAYRDAYKAGGTDMTIAVSANKLLKNMKVKQAIAAAEERIQMNVISDAVRTRQFVMEQLLAKAREGKTEATQLKALELMGRAVSMFSDRVEQTVEHIDPDRLKEELRSHLILIDAAQNQ
jgi:phage terminase small subunit